MGVLLKALAVVVVSAAAAAAAVTAAAILLQGWQWKSVADQHN